MDPVSARQETRWRSEFITACCVGSIRPTVRTKGTVSPHENNGPLVSKEHELADSLGFNIVDDHTCLDIPNKDLRAPGQRSVRAQIQEK